MVTRNEREVGGALRQRCEETFGRLSPAAQGALDEVLSELVTLSGDAQETFARRTVPLDRFAAHPVQKELIDAMARLALVGCDSANVRRSYRYSIPRMPRRR